jgi:hypothetical protein
MHLVKPALAAALLTSLNWTTPAAVPEQAVQVWQRWEQALTSARAYTNAYADIVLPRVNFTGDIPSYAYALYEGASQWRAESPAVTLAAAGEPLFQRSPERYNSHLQTPFDHTTSYAALARCGRGFGSCRSSGGHPRGSLFRIGLTRRRL